MRDGSLYYEKDPSGVDVIVEDVSTSSYIAMREVRWKPEGDFKFDIRRYFIKQDGEELPGKGVGISDPNHLVNIMIASGYGTPATIMEHMDKQDNLVDGLGEYCAGFNDEDYRVFKEAIDDSRAACIEARGMSQDEFMETLK